MHSKLVISLLFIAAIVLAVFHDLSIRLNWYYTYPFIDIPLHVLGGFVVGLFTYIFTAATQAASRAYEHPFQLLSIILLGTLFVSLLWETFELVFYLTKDAGLSLETVSDIIFGVVGAGIAWFVVWLIAPKTST